MKTNSQKLIDLLSEREGLELLDVKFFRGSDRNTTKEELIGEAVKAANQVVCGFSKPKTSIDRGIEKTDLAQFLQH